MGKARKCGDERQHWSGFQMFRHGFSGALSLVRCAWGTAFFQGHCRGEGAGVVAVVALCRFYRES